MDKAEELSGMKPVLRTVDQALIDLGDLFKERNALYGDNYKRFGPSLFALMGPVRIDNAHDMNRFAILVQVFAKVSRYVQMFGEGGHHDSLDDLSVYAQMLQELDRMDPSQLSLFR